MQVHRKLELQKLFSSPNNHSLYLYTCFDRESHPLKLNLKYIRKKPKQFHSRFWVTLSWFTFRFQPFFWKLYHFNAHLAYKTFLNWEYFVYGLRTDSLNSVSRSDLERCPLSCNTTFCRQILSRFWACPLYGQDKNWTHRQWNICPYGCASPFLSWTWTMYIHIVNGIEWVCPQSRNKT